MGDYLLPEYLRQPPVRDVPSEPVKIPSSQIDPRAAMAFSLIDLASMAPGGGGGALAAAPLGIAARRAARAARGAVASAEEIIPAANPRAVIGGNMPPPEAKFAQYAEQYPPTGEPLWQVNEKGKPYPSKVLTPEAIAFQKERAKIMKDMQTKGYTPFFDPEQRFMVDPRNYPGPNVNTLDIMPARQETAEKYWHQVGGDEARARLAQAYDIGKEFPDMGRWYAMGQMEQKLVEMLGPEQGRKAFQDWAVSMGTTTAGADPRSNMLMGQYGRYLTAHGQPIPEQGAYMPFPIGGERAGSNMATYGSTIEEGGWPSIGAANPKRHNFIQNFLGNPNVATIDEQMASGATPGVTMPPPGTYGMYEQPVHELARERGVTPMEIQETAWGGYKRQKEGDYTGMPMIEHINEAIERTHRLTGMPREEIFRRGFGLGEIPIYGAAGLSVLPLARGEEQP